jgi:hypothetical protein
VAGEIQVLDLLGGGLEAVATRQLVVEVGQRHLDRLPSYETFSRASADRTTAT